MQSRIYFKHSSIVHVQVSTNPTVIKLQINLIEVTNKDGSNERQWFSNSAL